MANPREERFVIHIVGFFRNTGERSWEEFDSRVWVDRVKAVNEGYKIASARNTGGILAQYEILPVSTFL